MQSRMNEDRTEASPKWVPIILYGGKRRSDLGRKMRIIIARRGAIEGREAFTDHLALASTRLHETDRGGRLRLGRCAYTADFPIYRSPHKIQSAKGLQDQSGD